MKHLAFLVDHPWGRPPNTACGALGGEHRLHPPSSTCPVCLVSLDVLLTAGLATIIPHNNGTAVRIDRRAFPKGHAPTLAEMVMALDLSREPRLSPLFVSPTVYEQLRVMVRE